MREMFAVAQRTPSWCNSRAWQTSGETTDKFRAGLARLVVVLAENVNRDALTTHKESLPCSS